MEEKDEFRAKYDKKKKGKKKKKRFVYRANEGYKRKRFDWRNYFVP